MYQLFIEIGSFRLLYRPDSSCVRLFFATRACLSSELPTHAHTHTPSDGHNQEIKVASFEQNDTELKKNNNSNNLEKHARCVYKMYSRVRNVLLWVMRNKWTVLHKKQATIYWEPRTDNETTTTKTRRKNGKHTSQPAINNQQANLTNGRRMTFPKCILSNNWDGSRLNSIADSNVSILRTFIRTHNIPFAYKCKPLFTPHLSCAWVLGLYGVVRVYRPEKKHAQNYR